MGRFLAAYMAVDAGERAPPPLAALVPPRLRRCFGRALLYEFADACSCVSSWCEGNLCPLPNPAAEKISRGGVEHYTSGGVSGWRKSGVLGALGLVVRQEESRLRRRHLRRLRRARYLRLFRAARRAPPCRRPPRRQRHTDEKLKLYDDCKINFWAQG